jgi:hypothetical protein
MPLQTQPYIQSQPPTNKRDLLSYALKAYSVGDKRAAAHHVIKPHKFYFIKLILFLYQAYQIGNELSDMATQLSLSILDTAPAGSDPQWTDTSSTILSLFILL